MARTDPKPNDAGTPVADEFPVSLDNFCSDLSQSDRRVELIGGFHYSERAAGRTKDTPSAFRARYVAFTTRAV